MFISNQRKRHDIAQAGGVGKFNIGGRVPFVKGKLVDEGRRAFMKWLAGMTGAAVATGTGLIKWGKLFTLNRLYKGIIRFSIAD